jgi:hypothetical protein
LSYVHLPKSIYSTPNAAGENDFAFYTGSTLALSLDANYGNFPVGLKIGSGKTIAKYLKEAATLDFPELAANTTAELTFTIAGAASGDQVFVAPTGAPESGLVWCGYVSAPDTVTVRLGNVTAGAINPADRIYNVSVIKH